MTWNYFNLNIVPMRIRVIERKRFNGSKSHKCLLYRDDNKRKSRKCYFSFEFDDEKIHKELIDLAKVADKRMPMTMAILHLNSECETVRKIANLFVKGVEKNES